MTTLAKQDDINDLYFLVAVMGVLVAALCIYLLQDKLVISLKSLNDTGVLPLNKIQAGTEYTFKFPVMGLDRVENDGKHISE